MPSFRHKVFSLLIVTLLLPTPGFAGGEGCVGRMCGGQRTYWSDEQRAAVEQRGFGGFWAAMGEREREMFPNFYGAGQWGMKNIVGPALGVAFGSWMQRNFWMPLDQTPPDIDIFPQVPGEGYLIAGVAKSLSRAGRALGEVLKPLKVARAQGARNFLAHLDDAIRTSDAFIDHRALQLAKRKAGLVAGERTVTWWRVQNRAARDIVVDPTTGGMKITPGWSRRHGKTAHYPKAMFASRGGPEHAEHFARLRRSQGQDVEIVSFEVPGWFDDLARETAIPQEAARMNPLFDKKLGVQIVDPDMPGEAFEFGRQWRGLFDEAVVPGSGVIHGVP